MAHGERPISPVSDGPTALGRDGSMESEKRLSTFRRILAKIGLSGPIVLLMLKGSIGPTVGLAIYQINSVARHFSTIGYLIPIMSILTIPVAPRARFIQNLLVTTLLIGFAAAISLFSMWCSVRARANTTHISKEASSNGPIPGASVSPFNAAASVNMAMWLFFEVWLANTFRAFRPQYFLPSIVFSIFIQVTSTYGSQFSTMDEAGALVKHLVESFFAGFGLSAAVNMLILPITSRDLVTTHMTENLHAIKRTLTAQSEFMLSLASYDWYAGSGNSDLPGSRTENDCNSRQETAAWPEAGAFRKTTANVAEGLGKLKSELRYAKREAGWAHLGPRELVDLTHLLENILSPILGMTTLVQVADRIKKLGGWEAFRGYGNRHTTTELGLNACVKEKQRWNSLFEQLRDHARQLQQAMTDGIDHSMYTLQLGQPPALRQTDLETNRPCISKHLEEMIGDFLERRQGPLNTWCALSGLGDPSHVEYLRSGVTSPDQAHARHQFQLYFFLSLEYSFVATARGILNLVEYADSKVDDGTMKKKRFIVPTRKQMKKWFWASMSREDCHLDYADYSRRSGTVAVSLEDVLQTEKDADHLSPETWWEIVTDKFRVIPRFFGSAESVFGFRVAVATMCFSVVAFLRNSQHFYIEQRLIWGSIMVAISMTQTAGSGMYAQFERIAGTVIAMVLSYIDWYIVDAQPAGVIVFVGLTMFVYHYLFIRFPSHPVLPMIGMVTVMLIVGYALQVKKLGILISESNGQQYYALYVLAPYRLAAVLTGVGIAFLFTYFPYVVTVRTRLRKDLGSVLFLLAHYYSAVYTTASLSVRDLGGDYRDKKSPGRVIRKARRHVLAKILVLLQCMKQHIAFTAWEPTFGGKFPNDIYDELINHTRNILHSSAMIVYVTDSFQDNPTNVTNSMSLESWLKDFKQLITSLDLRSHEVTSFLGTVSGAIATGNPLPLYLKAPKIPLISELLADLDASILNVKHVCEPGYSSFAAMDITMAILTDDLSGLLHETKSLVGELDFRTDIIRNKDVKANLDSIRAAEKSD